MPRIYAVLTGDLIGSTAAGAEALSAAMTEIAEVAGEIAAWQGGADSRFTRSRGDAWQMVLHTPSQTLRAVLMLQARLRAQEGGIPTRISLAIGPVDSLGTRDLSDAGGAAFTASGQGLDHMPRMQRVAVSAGPETPLLQAILTLADELARRWSREQAEAMAMALAPAQPTLAAMATRLAISAQAVNYRLNGAGLRAIRQALQGWEAALAPKEHDR